MPEDTRPSQTPGRSGFGTAIAATLAGLLTKGFALMGVDVGNEVEIAVVALFAALFGAAATWARDLLARAETAGEPKSFWQSMLSVFG